MRSIKDMTGKIFGRLTVLELSHVDKSGAHWICKCECGARKTFFGSNLRKGLSKSCGCLHKDTVTTHGLWDSRLYKIYYNMISRCANPKTTEYKNYGGRGISICVEWMDSFDNFSNWAYGNGYDDSLTIERKDVNGNYCPENCRWATGKEQGFNRRNNRRITINGVTKTITEWANERNISFDTLYGRISRGWEGERLLTPPNTKKYRPYDAK